jgi:hypothetical protein
MALSLDVTVEGSVLDRPTMAFAKRYPHTGSDTPVEAAMMEPSIKTSLSAQVEDAYMR